MDFAIRRDAREWFAGISREKGTKHTGQLDLEFDIFYFCFIAGIRWARKHDLPASDTDSLVDNYPGRYKTRGRLYVALFLSCELERLGIGLDERKVVYQQISKLVDHSSPNHLSDDGVREFNKYAHGGFDVLIELFEERPRTLDTFLIEFWQKVSADDGGR